LTRAAQGRRLGLSLDAFGLTSYNSVAKEVHVELEEVGEWTVKAGWLIR
jgi:hypothetical protein